MNSDASFCLGLNAGEYLKNDSDARSWWDKLLVFLTCQETAAEERAWPQNIEISHGAAGPIEVSAEMLASEVGLFDDYRQAVSHNTGAIATEATSLAKKGRLRNGRAKCICGRLHKDGKVMLRRECQPFRDSCIVSLETRRRSEEHKFWQALKAAGYKCCGTMDDCPLRP